jgi:hypothetical protein
MVSYTDLQNIYVEFFSTRKRAEEVFKWAREHFGCVSLKKIEIENGIVNQTKIK